MRSALAAAVLLLLPSLAPAEEPRCSDLGAARTDTVIVIDTHGDFTLCRGGEVRPDVVAGRPVWLELRRTNEAPLFEFRVAEPEEAAVPTGLAVWQEQAASLGRALARLGDGEETISELARPTSTPSAAGAPRSTRLATSLALYLGNVTPRFHEALDGVTANLDEMPAIAEAVAAWCREAHRDAALSVGALASVCASPDLVPASIAHERELLQNAIRDFRAHRSTAREALIAADAAPSDAAAQQAAVAALDAARSDAMTIAADATRLRPMVRDLGRAASLVRQALHSRGILRPGVPVLLARYDHGGNAVLRVEARPIGIAAAGAKVVAVDTHVLTYRFLVVETHYVDLEAGLGITGGLPDVPTLVTSNGMSTIEGKSVDEFVGLALVELEPARFLWPDRPLAGLLRLPVLGIPLSVNPTNNFFIGAGLGWTGVGSVTVGPYLAREITLAPGHSIGQPLPAGASFAAITRPAVQVGYFVSVSVDLVGLFHLFYHPAPKTLDAATGKDL